MSKNHLKTLNTPKTWTINRKESKFVTRPNPGAHKIELSLTLNMILKTILGRASTKKEVKKILHKGEVLVNGKKRTDVAYPMGLMDILTIPKNKESHIMLINSQNKLYLQSIDTKEADRKLSKIIDKKITKKGITQIKTLDGRTILVKKNVYKTGDTIVLSIPKQEIKDIIKLEKGATILLFRGKHVGKIATITEIQGTVLKFKHESGEFETKKNYAIVIGKDKPLIKIK